jgi:hypothetical protein
MEKILLYFLVTLLHNRNFIQESEVKRQEVGHATASTKNSKKSVAHSTAKCCLTLYAKSLPHSELACAF